MGEWRYSSITLDIGIRWGGVSGQVHVAAASLGTEYTGGWVGPRVSIDVMEKRNTFFPCRESNIDPSVV
jgi:hypothetical protein